MGHTHNTQYDGDEDCDDSKDDEDGGSNCAGYSGDPELVFGI